MSEFLDSLKNASRKIDSLYIERALDATPIDIEFGGLQDVLMESSRFRYLDGQGKWQLLSWDSARKLKLRCKTGAAHLTHTSLCACLSTVCLSACLSVCLSVCLTYLSFLSVAVAAYRL